MNTTTCIITLHTNMHTSAILTALGSIVVMRVRALNPFAAALKTLKLTPNQQLYSAALQDPAVHVIVCHGESGTAKSTLAILNGLSELRRKNIDRFIITRPTVLCDNDAFGSLPGGAEQKTAPLFRHISDIAHAADAGGSAAAAHGFLKEKHLDIIPLEFMRGLTFDNSWVLMDEAQNSTPRQMKLLLTRIGKRSKVIIAGDIKQSDLKGPNGLADIIDRINRQRDLETETNQKFAEEGISLNSIQLVTMTHGDIKRSALVKMISGWY